MQFCDKIMSPFPNTQYDMFSLGLKDNMIYTGKYQKFEHCTQFHLEKRKRFLSVD